MELVVRLANFDEAETLAALHRAAAIGGYAHIFPEKAAPPTPDEMLAQWRLWLGPDRDDGLRAFVADDDATVVGVVLAGPDPADPNCGHVARLYVRPDRWGRAVGTTLYARAIAYLREAGYSEATLWVLEHNLRARSWYERLGWRPTGERKHVYAPGQIDDIRYRISLGP